MLKPMESSLEAKTDQVAFITIDDCVNQAENLFAGLKKLSQFKHPLSIRRGIGKEVKVGMGEEKTSKQLKGSSRTYFFDVAETREGKAYLRITESRKGKEDKFERNSILVFPEDAGSFAQTVTTMTGKLK